MNPWILAGILLAVLTGALLPLQALINARLGQQTSGALFASFASFLIGTIAIGIALLVTRTSLPTWQQRRVAIGWLGGVIAQCRGQRTVLVRAGARRCYASLSSATGRFAAARPLRRAACANCGCCAHRGAALSRRALMVFRPWEGRERTRRAFSSLQGKAGWDGLT